MFYSHYQPVESQPLKENKVSNSHMSALQMKHAKLETKLDYEENRPSPDDDLIHDLKKQKLQIKDTIAQELTSA